MEVDHDFFELEVTHNEFEEDGEEEVRCEKGAPAGYEKMETEDESVQEHLQETFHLNNGTQHDLRKKIIENKEKKKLATERIEIKDNFEKDETVKKDRKQKSRNNHQYQRQNGQRNFNKKLFKELHASPDLDPGILGREIAHRLGEVKVGLIANVVRVLGFKTAMKILDETRRIERRGGIMTTDGSRRREPGGVYIYCLKEKGYATKDEVDLIFKEEKERLKEAMKKKKKRLQNLKKQKEIQKLDQLKKRALESVKKQIKEDAENMKTDETFPNENGNPEKDSSEPNREISEG